MDDSVFPIESRKDTHTETQHVNARPRKPTIPVGIVTTRLVQLKTLTDDTGSVIRHHTGHGSSKASGHRAGCGFVIPASRSTIFHQAIPQSDRSDIENGKQTGSLNATPDNGQPRIPHGPRASKSYDVLSPYVITKQDTEPVSVPRAVCNNIDGVYHGILRQYRNNWVNGDGVQEEQRTAHVCHSYGEWISFEDPCLSCGHAFCARCTADAEEGSQTPTGTSTHSSSTTPQRQRERSELRRLAADNESPQWEHDSHCGSKSLSSSTRSIPRAKALSSVYLNQPARHCICCIARQPSGRRQTEPALPAAHYGLSPEYAASESGSSTVTHATTISNLRLPDNLVEEQALRPAALQPRRSTNEANTSPTKARASDPYVGKRLMRPHPQPPEPTMESWPRLRRVPEAVNGESNDEVNEAPWSREALRRVSKPATGENQSYKKPTTNPEWTARLRKVREPTAADAVDDEPWRSRKPNSPLDRSEQDCVYYDRNRSESVRPSERPVSSNYDPPVPIRSSTKSPSVASRTSRSSLRQTESSLARTFPVQNLGNEDEMEPSRQPRLVTPSRARARTLPTREMRPTGIMKSQPKKTKDPHSCTWRDRFMDLSAEVDQLRNELESCQPSGANSPYTVPNERECGDAGIDGLTVVIHLKGRDDLVINTDLRNA